MTATPTEVDFHFDPMCPFAYHTSRWVREVRAHTGLKVNWRFFSLEEVNRFEGKKHPWQRQWSYGWSQLRIAALLRRRDPALLDAWYARVGRELHLDGGKPHDPATARDLLAEIGVEPGLLDEALADPSTHDDILADHRRVIDAGGFGVPTLFFPDGQCLFGPVLVDPPSGQAAVRLWELVTGMLEFPHVYELQRPKNERDEQVIACELEPYVRGRDWVSVNRGRIVEVPKPTGGHS
ncbi:putative dithiol-disulfide isomerase involved in polyketide biosynthesis [Saccharomonospora marina XMU15]|uniref:Putative dithiol-disulfide isomerase involved in polyketide biosynthesis n=1 Tax=Saccharomonospora marina XMU15 TaxID=882083 RepID=H5X8E1_9PSEU|nr:DsbA family protein [Saccharomonospora marina]EHR50237.1 putative dithiol-disulfide isomerase involved in polyketide biosynthesis [Saccharomonospora marina XMU15]